MFLMSGASLEHTRINTNITVELGLQLRGTPCQIFAIDLRTKVTPTGLYTYPDITAVCGEPQCEDEHGDTLLNPILIIEVLSTSTEYYDRGKKFAHYRTLTTLKEYVLVSQYECRVEKFTLTENGIWTYMDCSEPSGSVELTSIGCHLSLALVYDKVDFARAKRRLERAKEA